MYVNIYAFADFIIYRMTPSGLAPSSTTSILFDFFVVVVFVFDNSHIKAR